MPLLERSGGQNVFGHACGTPASLTEIRLTFAGLPQAPRKHGWHLRESRKSHGDTVGICGTPASLTEIRLAFAGIPQVSRRYGWRLRGSCKSHGDTVGVCGTFVDTLPTLFLHRTHVSLPLMNLIHLPRHLPFNLVHHLDCGLDGGFDLVGIEATRLEL